MELWVAIISLRVAAITSSSLSSLAVGTENDTSSKATGLESWKTPAQAGLFQAIFRACPSPTSSIVHSPSTVRSQPTDCAPFVASQHDLICHRSIDLFQQCPQRRAFLKHLTGHRWQQQSPSQSQEGSLYAAGFTVPVPSSGCPSGADGGGRPGRDSRRNGIPPKRGSEAKYNSNLLSEIKTHLLI